MALHSRPLLADPDAIAALAANLGQCPSVTRHDKAEEPQAWTLAYSLRDMEEECRQFTDMHLPSLMKADATAQEIQDALQALQMSYHHMLYHIMDPAYFGFDMPDWLGSR